MWVIKKKFFYADFTCQVKSALVSVLFWTPIGAERARFWYNMRRNMRVRMRQNQIVCGARRGRDGEGALRRSSGRVEGMRDKELNHRSQPQPPALT